MFTTQVRVARMFLRVVGWFEKKEIDIIVTYIYITILQYKVLLKYLKKKISVNNETSINELLTCSSLFMPITRMLSLLVTSRADSWMGY